MSKNPSEPIGHLPDEPLHQQQRDAAAGPPVGGTPKSSHEWPGPVKPSTRWTGPGPRDVHFRCATCGRLNLASIVELIQHTITSHHRGPYETERIPLPPVKGTA